MRRRWLAQPAGLLLVLAVSTAWAASSAAVAPEPTVTAEGEGGPAPTPRPELGSTPGDDPGAATPLPQILDISEETPHALELA